ncbi:FAD-dependent thiol oxidase [Auricularia subglabra TFB-10046 SS5]|nr:FAD-dependent thiol oxidase [Auricularia subglabra TFB-10046 SS5]
MGNPASNASSPASSNAPGSPGSKPPPGMIIGPDGKPCRACDGFRAFTKNAALMGAAAAAAQPEKECPPDRDTLGRATWTFLHTTAAYYPAAPSAAQRTHMLALLRALPVLYPCSHCAEHLGEQMAVASVKAEQAVASQNALSRWLCERHNEVNALQGKPLFDCSKTDERWKDGPPDGSCD